MTQLPKYQDGVSKTEASLFFLLNSLPVILTDPCVITCLPVWLCRRWDPASWWFDTGWKAGGWHEPQAMWMWFPWRNASVTFMNVFWLQMTVWEVRLTVFWSIPRRTAANGILYSISYAGSIVSWHSFISLKFRFRISPSRSTHLCVSQKKKLYFLKEWFLDLVKVVFGSSDFQIKKLMNSWHWIFMRWN